MRFIKILLIFGLASAVLNVFFDNKSQSTVDSHTSEIVSESSSFKTTEGFGKSEVGIDFVRAQEDARLKKDHILKDQEYQFVFNKASNSHVMLNQSGNRFIMIQKISEADFVPWEVDCEKKSMAIVNAAGKAEDWKVVQSGSLGDVWLQHACKLPAGHL